MTELERCESEQAAMQEQRCMPKSPCDTCAFGKSGGAADEPKNSVKGMICAYGAIPFWCHHGKDGAEYDWQGSALGPMELAPGNRKICAGWQDYVRRLKHKGFFPNADYRVIRKVVAQRALLLLEKLTNDKTPKTDRPTIGHDLERCMKFLVKRDIGEMEIPL